MTAGWVEAIKHGLILDERLLHTFEEERDAILALERVACTGVIRRSVALKAQVVSRDERETLGVRILLNYGHTLGTPSRRPPGTRGTSTARRSASG